MLRPFGSDCMVYDATSLLFWSRYSRFATYMEYTGMDTLSKPHHVIMR